MYDVCKPQPWSVGEHLYVLMRSQQGSLEKAVQSHLELSTLKDQTGGLCSVLLIGNSSQSIGPKSHIILACQVFTKSGLFPDHPILLTLNLAEIINLCFNVLTFVNVYTSYSWSINFLHNLYLNGTYLIMHTLTS